MDTYWDEFYAKDDLFPEILKPSLFSYEVIQYLGKDDLVVDIGCGNGRDLNFFGTKTSNLIGADKSQIALDLIASNFPNLLNSSLIKIDLGLDEDISKLRDLIYERLKNTDSKLHLYCRFLIHAINDDEFNLLLQLVSDLKNVKPTVFFEYREFNEHQMNYQFPSHTRYFRKTETIIEALSVHGLTLTHKSTSVDYSPIGNERPLLTRLIAEIK